MYGSVVWIPPVVARVWGEGTRLCQEVEVHAGPWFAEEIADVGVSPDSEALTRSNKYQSIG